MVMMAPLEKFQLAKEGDQVCANQIILPICSHLVISPIPHSEAFQYMSVIFAKLQTYFKKKTLSK